MADIFSAVNYTVAHNTRHLILGLVEGGVSALSILTTSYFLGSFSGIEIFKLCLSVGIANMVSNFGGGYLAEEAEHGKRQNYVERSMGVEQGYLNRTAFQFRAANKSFMRALVFGFSSFISLIICGLPMLWLPLTSAFIASILLAVFVLVIVSFVLSQLSGQAVIFSLLKVLVISMVVFLLNLFVGHV